MCQRFLASTRRGLIMKPLEVVESAAPAGQWTIDFSGTHKQQLDSLCGMAIFAGARPFSMFDDESMIQFINALNPQYQIPSRGTISGSLLADCYKTTWDQMLAALAKCRYINITVDESTDIRRRRIMNMSITDSMNRYH